MKSLILLPLIVPLAACNPHVTIDQAKPIEVNINFNGHLDLVVHDAQNDLQQIKGGKPRNTVNLEDIGLPANATSPGAALPGDSDDPFQTFQAIAPSRSPAPAKPQWFNVATVDDLKRTMAARDAAVQGLWDKQLVGEGHDGLLTVKGALKPDEKQTMDAENADRTALYALEAAQKKIPVADVSISYYVARLGYATKGAWYEKKNAAGQWEWQQWAK